MAKYRDKSLYTLADPSIPPEALLERDRERSARYARVTSTVNSSTNPERTQPCKHAPPAPSVYLLAPRLDPTRAARRKWAKWAGCSSFHLYSISRVK